MSFNNSGGSDLVHGHGIMALTAVSSSSMPPKVGFELLPFLVFRQICSHLEPIWLWNLSHCWSVTFHRLSFEEGNLIWYESLPSHVLKAKERYQNERELEYVLRDQPETVTGSGLAPTLMQNRGTGVLEGLLSAPTSISQPFDYLEEIEQGGEPGRRLYDMFPEHEQILRPGSTAVHDMLSTQILSLAPATVHDMLSAQFLRLAPTTVHQLLPVRKRVKALGAGYELVFNYKREILGRLKSGQRCYICLCVIPGMLHTHIAEWGLKWCPVCFKKYTVVATKVFEHEYHHVTALATSARRTSGAGRRIYLRPELDHIVRGFIGFDLRTHWMQPKQMKQRVEYMRVEDSRLEKERLQIRLKLVKYAEMIWEGRNPCYEMVIENNATTPEPRVNWPVTPDTFRTYRERFAPSSKIAQFLFPGHLVTGDPTSTPCTESGGWLKDPVRALRRGTTVDKVQDIWFVDAAFAMIKVLVNWNIAKYNMKGKGGYVDEWVKAAKSYHIYRLEDDLKKGVVVGITHAPNHEHGEEYFSRIRKLRAKCGLQQEGDIFMPKLPARIPVWNFNYSDVEYARQDSAAAKAISKHHEKIKNFNKIIRDICIICPETGLKLNQMGLEELVNHMHLCHPERFWEKDDWHIIG